MKRVAATLLALVLAAPDARADEPQDVDVHGTKVGKPGAQTTLGGAEVREVPGAFGDAFRVVETLPGVTPIVSGLPYFFVRGAPPGNTGYFLDGVRVPLLFHVAFGPSVVAPGLVERVDFFPGGYPAQYGRFVGGIMAGTARRPADEEHAEGNVRLFDAGALVETPFADGRGTALLAGRYSYTAPLVSIFDPHVTLDYWDYQSRVTWRTGEHDTFGIFAFGSHDYLAQDASTPNRASDADIDSSFHRVDARWDHDLPHHGHMRVAATLGLDETSTDQVSGVRDRSLSLRLGVEQPVGGHAVVHAGLDTTLDRYDLDGGKGPLAALYPARDDLATGAYVDATMRITDRWEVTPGLRADVYGSVRPLAGQLFAQRTNVNASVPALDPRLASRLRLSSRVTAVSTIALTHQTPSFFVPVPGLQLGTLAQGLQTGIQSSEGVEVTLPAGFTFTPTAFYHQYLGLTDFLATCSDVNPLTTTVDCQERRVRGRTVGVEVLLRRALTQKLAGWVSYTLSRTTRASSFVTPPIFEDIYAPRPQRTGDIPGDFDRTHVLNVIGAYDLGRRWRAGARFFFYTGRPYSDRIADTPIPPFNDHRYPPFYRVDLRLEKAWPMGEHGKVALVFEWLNATLQKEATSLVCTRSANPRANDSCTYGEIGPISIPSVGVEGQL